jgi:hypothetical protein
LCCLVVVGGSPGLDEWRYEKESGEEKEKGEGGGCTREKSRRHRASEWRAWEGGGRGQPQWKKGERQQSRFGDADEKRTRRRRQGEREEREEGAEEEVRAGVPTVSTSAVPSILVRPSVYLRRLRLLYRQSGNDDARPKVRLPRLHLPFSSLPNNRVFPCSPFLWHAQRIQKLLRLLRHERLKEDTGESERFRAKEEGAMGAGGSSGGQPWREVLNALVGDSEDVEDGGEGTVDLEGSEVGGESS